MSYPDIPKVVSSYSFLIYEEKSCCSEKHKFITENVFMDLLQQLHQHTNNVGQSLMLCERMTRHQIRRGISEPPKYWLTVFWYLLFYWFVCIKILRYRFHQWLFLPTLFPLSINATSLSRLICSLCLSLPPTFPIPRYVLPVFISHKYSADLMFDYHWSQ
jgi:hypothetical protein